LNSPYVLPPRRRLIQFLLSLIERRKENKNRKKKKAEKKPRRNNEFRKPNHDRKVCGILWLALGDDMIKFRPHWLCMKGKEDNLKDSPKDTDRSP